MKSERYRCRRKDSWGSPQERDVEFERLGFVSRKQDCWCDLKFADLYLPTHTATSYPPLLSGTYKHNTRIDMR